MKAKSNVPKTYKAFLRDEGSPTKLHYDGAAEQKSVNVGEINREHGIQESFSEPKIHGRTQWKPEQSNDLDKQR
jgi:hypothetical protein